MSGASLWTRLKASFAASAGNVVFGMEDGTVSIFGLVFGVAATTSDQSTVLIAGASGAVAAAVSMMAGTYLDVETSADQARLRSARIASAMADDPARVRDRVTRRLQAAGMAHEETAMVDDFLAAQPAVLKGFAAALAAPAEQGPSNSPLIQSLWMLVADFLAAAIPILPFGFLPVPEGRWVSGTVTTLLLVALGVGRSQIGGRPVLRTVAETVAIGVAAALAGVGIGVVIARIFS
jgi:vacuolar iron transporter family protein